MAGLCEGGNEPPGSLNANNTESYPAFAHLGSRENPGRNLNQVTCPDRESNLGRLVSRPDALTVTPQRKIAPRFHEPDCVLRKKRLREEDLKTVSKSDRVYRHQHFSRRSTVAVWLTFAPPDQAVRGPIPGMGNGRNLPSVHGTEYSSVVLLCLNYILATGVAQSVKALAYRSEVVLGRGFDPRLG
ncbi:hypothetical protein ANN_27047 [Periplaneta americana]|uniref:Uncharacterized protein n=1 Tax=Periplaneta americana TaxID=6978 RepID=A0ABQ8RX18_PERAM|nr:hypothetical protein ANN_27047 [Periplaneta americana]